MGLTLDVLHITVKIGGTSFDKSVKRGLKVKQIQERNNKMKRFYVSRVGWRVALVLVVGLSIGLVSFAQTPRGAKGAPMYTPATETTVKGTIEAINQITGRQGWGGTHLELKTESETLDVHVGPSWFLSQNKMTFAQGDEIEVTGSKVKFDNADALLAREITKGGQKLTLRNKNGFPVWSHRGRS